MKRNANRNPSKGSKPAPAPQPKTTPKSTPGASARSRRAERHPIREYCGDWVTGNYWIKIGLTRNQVKALTRLGKNCSTSESPCAAAALLLISLGLLNEDDTISKSDAVVRYMKAEGFTTFGEYCQGAMRAKEAIRE